MELNDTTCNFAFMEFACDTTHEFKVMTTVVWAVTRCILADKAISPNHTVSYHIRLRQSTQYLQSFIYSPSDALVSCLKNIKIYIKIYIKTSPTCFGVNVRQYYCRTVQQTYTKQELIYAATPSPY